MLVADDVELESKIDEDEELCRRTTVLLVSRAPEDGDGFVVVVAVELDEYSRLLELPYIGGAADAIEETMLLLLLDDVNADELEEGRIDVLDRRAIDELDEDGIDEVDENATDELDGEATDELVGLPYNGTLVDAVVELVLGEVVLDAAELDEVVLVELAYCSKATELELVITAELLADVDVAANDDTLAELEPIDDGIALIDTNDVNVGENVLELLRELEVTLVTDVLCVYCTRLVAALVA